MKKIREVLRLKHALGLSERQIAKSCKLSRSTVANYLGRAEKVSIGWPVPPELDDATLDCLLFPRVPTDTVRVLPDWGAVHRDLKRKGVTRQLLWMEYKANNPTGIEYTTFTIMYREWKKQLDVVMRQDYRAGEKMFVDYAGMTVAITNPDTGEITQAEVFTAVLGASNYTYAEATATQGSLDWLASHCRAITYFQGVAEVVVPDNLKSGVTSADYYEPDLNFAYAELAQHYGFAVIPTRRQKPRDKAKVESGVLIVERQILAKLRNRTFYRIAEANEAIWELLEILNNKPFQKLDGTRHSLFLELEKPALRPLPTQSFTPGWWRKARVGIDHHIQVEHHYYSVPYRYVKEQVDVKITSSTLEVFFKNQRIAVHARIINPRKGQYVTISEHRPKAHRAHAEWTPGRLIAWAEKTGVFTGQLVTSILDTKLHPEQGYRSCLGIMRLAKTYPSERLENACRHACEMRTYSYKSLASILKHNLDQQPHHDPRDDTGVTHAEHANVRGADYYQTRSDRC